MVVHSFGVHLTFQKTPVEVTNKLKMNSFIFELEQLLQLQFLRNVVLSRAFLKSLFNCFATKTYFLSPMGERFSSNIEHLFVLQ